MKSKHITKILDETPFKDLSGVQISEIRAHAENCADCHTAFQAARVSSALMASRASEVFEPSPFFETRVLAALREKQIVAKPIAAFWRWWRASSIVVFPILLVVITLMALTLYAPKQPVQATASTEDLAPEQIIFQGNDSNQKLTTSQAMQIIYEQNNSK